MKFNESVTNAVSVCKPGFSETELQEEYGEEENVERLLPLYIRMMVEEETIPGRPLTQQRILEKLDEYPYSLSPEIKSVYRVVNTLVKEYPGICKDSENRVYADKRRKGAVPEFSGNEGAGNVNSRKSLLPVFIYDILKNETDSSHRLSQTQLVGRLEDGVHRITAGRKAVARWLESMSGEEVCHICGNGKDGYWYDKNYFGYAPE